MYCPNCGSEIGNDSVFCEFCGERIDGDADQTTVRQPVEQPDPQPVEQPASQSVARQQAKTVSGRMIAGVVAAALIAGGAAAYAVQSGLGNQGASETATANAATANDATASKLSLSVTATDTSSYPKITATIKAADSAGAGVTDLSLSNFAVTEGGSTVAVSNVVSNGGGVYQLTYESTGSDDSTDPRTAGIAAAGTKYTWDAIGFTYNPPTNKTESSSSSSSDTSSKSDTSSGAATTNVIVVDSSKPVVQHIDSSDYILPNSDKLYYSTSDLTGLSDWELYVARNEIYARHGRAFHNDDLQRYFSRKTWYTQLYSADEFDSKVTLNSYEKKNAETILAYEKSIGSQYIN